MAGKAPIDGTVTDPDAALRDMLALAYTPVTGGPLFARLAGLVRRMDAHLSRGGALPLPWAGSAPPRDVREVIRLLDAHTVDGRVTLELARRVAVLAAETAAGRPR
jgi:hypothetical protein